MKKVIYSLIFSFLCVQCIGLVSFTSAALNGDPNFLGPLEDSISGPNDGLGNTRLHEDVGIADRLSEWSIDIGGGEEIRDFIAFVAVKILIPVFIFAGIVVAIIGFYKLMGSDSTEEQKKAFDYILRGTIGIVIMISAGFITNQLVGIDGGTGILGSIGAGDNDQPAGAVIAEELYLNIVFPLIRIFIYFVLGILFIMAMVHAFKYIFAKDDEFQRKSFTILIYNALGIVVIILAKSMIEIVYGKYSDVINAEVVSGGDIDVGKIGNGVLEAKDFGLMQTVINRILSIATFIVLVLIIYQSYQLLVNPSNEELVAGLRKNIAYTFIGILIIGAGYLLTSFFIIT